MRVVNVISLLCCAGALVVSSMASGALPTPERVEPEARIPIAFTKNVRPFVEREDIPVHRFIQLSELVEKLKPSKGDSPEAQ